MSYSITSSYKQIAKIKSKIKVVQGGTRAGKTIAILLLLLAEATKSKKVITITSESLPHLKKGALRDFLDILLEKRGDTNFYDYYVDVHNKSDNIFYLKNGSVIEFAVFPDRDSARGAGRDILFINEANAINYEVFRELYIRTEGDVYLDFNPVNEFWAHNKVLADKEKYDAEHIVLTYKDNEALKREMVKMIEAQKGDGTSNWWRVYGLGEIGSLEGNVYSGWTKGELDDSYKLVRYGLDFGFKNDETALVAVYENENGELFIKELLYKSGILGSQFKDVLDGLDIDPSVLIVADSARPEHIAEIKAGGYRIVGASKDKGSVLRGIDRVSQRKITYDGKNLEREFLTYAWRKKKTGETLDEPQDGNDHLLDSLRYAVDDLKKKRFDF